MNLLTAKQIKSWEYEHCRLSGESDSQLVTKAAYKFANFVDKKLLRDNMPISIIAGWGNNGADGFAIAELLKERLSPVVVYHIHPEKANSLCQHFRAKFTGPIKDVMSYSDLGNISEADIVIDAIIGTGAGRAFSPELTEMILYINTNSKHILSVDLPSGMLADSYTDHQTIEANETMCFSLPKLSCFSRSNSQRLGSWKTDIIDLDLSVKPESEILLVTKNSLRSRIAKRETFGHKGSYGHCLMIGSEKSKAGAIKLTAESAYRTGSGLVTIASCADNRAIIQTSISEAMFMELGQEYVEHLDIKIKDFACIAIGPGLGQNKTTAQVLSVFLKNCEVPLIIDADALNIIASEKLHAAIPPKSILTPHPKEFDRLFGSSENDFIRRQKQLDFAKSLGIYIILKGAYTTIATPKGKLYFNSNGNPGMATGGSGDVLTGMIASFVGQSYDHIDACLLSVFLHGYAGDLAAKELGEMSVMARDIINKIPMSIKSII